MNAALTPVVLTATDARYPSRLRERLDTEAPTQLTALGNLDLLDLPKIALFCSARCPGSAILATYDQSARWRDEGRCIISGFHSPVEKECLRILLRGTSPVIICPARSLPKRIPPDWQKPLTDGRLLILSCFTDKDRRVVSELAIRRNRFVAALADAHYFAHIAPGSHTAQLSQAIASW
ncbi:MAG: DNA-binding protein [Verrucomicrobia bacterium]|nr:DNA-binding protein [Verrucomicrobiota bacterium]